MCPDTCCSEADPANIFLVLIQHSTLDVQYLSNARYMYVREHGNCVLNACSLCKLQAAHAMFAIKSDLGKHMHLPNTRVYLFLS